MLPTTHTSDRFRTRRGARGPAWRWELANSSFPDSRLPEPFALDAHVAAAHAFVTAARLDGPSAAVERRPEIATAIDVNEIRPLRESLQLLALAACPRAEMANQLILDEATIETWERVFFDVRESLTAVGWVFSSVIRPAQLNGNGTFAAKLKAVYAGGPVVARALLDGETRISTVPGERLFDREMQLHLREDEALQVPLDSPRHALRFLKLSWRYQTECQRLELDKQKFAAACRENQRKHAIRLLRVELAHEKEQQRQEAKRRRVEQRKQQQQAKIALQAALEQRWRDQQMVSQQAAEQRAMYSPLAQLTWGTQKECRRAGRFETVPYETNTQPVRREVVAA